MCTVGVRSCVESFDSTLFKLSHDSTHRDWDAATFHSHHCAYVECERRLLLSLSQHMRRRNPHDSNNMAPIDYSPISQDPEDPSTKRGKSILPSRSYNARRRLRLLAICSIVGIGLFAAVRLFHTADSSDEGKVLLYVSLPLVTCP